MAELRKGDTVAYNLFGLFIASVIWVLDDQRSKDDLRWRSGSSSMLGAWKTAGKIGFHTNEDLIMIRQCIDLLTCSSDLDCRYGTVQLKEIHLMKAVAEHCEHYCDEQICRA